MSVVIRLSYLHVGLLYSCLINSLCVFFIQNVSNLYFSIILESCAYHKLLIRLVQLSNLIGPFVPHDHESFDVDPEKAVVLNTMMKSGVC